MLDRNRISVLPKGSGPPPVVLSVAGFDPSSGAGVTADLQTFAAHGMAGLCAITALTVQSTRGVFEVQPVEAGLLRRTLERLYDDLPIQGVKVGMLASAAIVHEVASFLHALGPTRPKVVLDPVLRSSSGAELLSREGVDLLQRELLPLVDWITPNWAELSVLSGRSVTDARYAVDGMHALGLAHPQLGIIATGGESDPPVDSLRSSSGIVQTFAGTHVETRSTHGTGCAFSSALLAALVAGKTPGEAVGAAKRFVEGALRTAPGLGSGRGPMDLLWPLHESRDGSATLA